MAACGADSQPAVFCEPRSGRSLCHGRRDGPAEAGRHFARQCLQVHAPTGRSISDARTKPAAPGDEGQDSGVGISTEEQSKIFERSYRAGKARSRAQGGAGLGLAIAQWIVAQHRGSIRVESQPSFGSTFIVELPIIAAPVGGPSLSVGSNCVNV